MKTIDESFFVERVKELRLKKGVSARDMSLALGQSESYVNRIETQKMLPSIKMFFSICDFFNITPSSFFQSEEGFDAELIAAMKKLQTLDKTKREHLLAVIEDM